MECNNLNTSVCEQTNYWFGRFKYILKHMNLERFHFLIFLLCDNYNKEKLVHQKYSELKDIKYSKTSQ